MYLSNTNYNPDPNHFRVIHFKGDAWYGAFRGPKLPYKENDSYFLPSEFLKVDCSCLCSSKESGKMACTLSVGVYRMKKLMSCKKKTFPPHSSQVIIQGL